MNAARTLLRSMLWGFLAFVAFDAALLAGVLLHANLPRMRALVENAINGRFSSAFAPEPKGRVVRNLRHLGLQRDDGWWNKGPSWWRKPGSPGSNVEVVEWGGRGPSEMTTLNALRILRAAGLLGV